MNEKALDTIQRGTNMKRRDVLGARGVLEHSVAQRRRRSRAVAAVALRLPMQVELPTGKPAGSDVFRDVGSKLRITNMKVFGVTLDEKIARSRPPVRFRQTRNQPRRCGLGRGNARREGIRGHGVRHGPEGSHRRQRSDAGRAPLSVHVYRQLLSRRSGLRIGHLRVSTRRCGISAARC